MMEHLLTRLLARRRGLARLLSGRADPLLPIQKHAGIWRAGPSSTQARSVFATVVGSEPGAGLVVARREGARAGKASTPRVRRADAYTSANQGRKKGAGG
jgi:hypothetical protein